MQLLHTPLTCSLSPLIVLNEAGLPFEVLHVDLAARRTADGRDLRTIAPKGQVPVLLLDDGSVLTEGVAIIQYLADRVPERGLAPAAGTFERVRLQEWLNYLATELHNAFGGYWAPTAGEAHRAYLRQVIEGHLARVDRHLSAQPFLMGGDYSIADAFLFTILGWARLDPWRIPLEPYPNLSAFKERVAARPAVQAALVHEAAAA
jgi:glutathione S-transferase